jgi:hypothetical protein
VVCQVGKGILLEVCEQELMVYLPLVELPLPVPDLTSRRSIESKSPEGFLKLQRLASHGRCQDEKELTGMSTNYVVE